MEGFNSRFGQNGHVNHMNTTGLSTDAVETTLNGMCLLSFCEVNNLYAANSFFFQKPNKRWHTWCYPRGDQGAVLEFYHASMKIWVTFLNTWAKKEADANSGYGLVTSNLKFVAIPRKLRKHINQTRIWK